MKYSICFSACLLLFGCSTLFPIQVTDPRTGIEYTVPTRLHDVPGIRELAEACATQAGRVVHRTVEVEGYYLGDVSECGEACWRELARSEYQFFEFNKVKLRSWDFLRETGLWRVSKQDANDSRCEAKPTKHIKRIAKRDGWEMTYCLAFQQIDVLKSEYRPTYNSIEKGGARPEFRLVEARQAVVDISESFELAYDISYTLFGARKTQYQGSSWGCSTIGIVPPGRGSGKFLAGEALKPK